MGITVDQIVDETGEWSEEAVDELVDHICRLTYGDSPAADEAGSHEEIDRLIADLESGRVQGVPLEERLTKARAILDS